MKSLRTSGRRQIATAAAAILLGAAVAAPAAFAARDDHEQRIPMPKPLYEGATAMLTQTESCKIYERRFDNSVGKHANAEKIDQARVLRIAGGKACGDGDYTLGIHRLSEALDDIGVSSTL